MSANNNPLAIYAGGIHSRVEAAIRKDGQVFRRYQERGRWGYAWTPWRRKETVDVNNIPHSLESGFSTLRRVDSDPYRSFKCRLPKD